MALPDLIEIVPLERPIKARIVAPGSKSITNRALILGALNKGECALRGALWSEDTQVMVNCLRELGFKLEVSPEASEPGNRILRIEGLGGALPKTKSEATHLFVGNAGTAARFLAAFVSLGKSKYHLSGVPRMHERPQAALFNALRELGYKIDSPNNKLPAVIHGGGARIAGCTVSIEESSQFASALLLCSEKGGWRVRVVGENAEESPYVAMTLQLLEQFAHNPEVFQVEPDASSGSYFYGADWLLKRNAATAESQVSVAGCPESLLQIDARFPEIISRFPDQISRRDDLGDSIMTAIVLAPFADGTKKFVELGRLRVQECERVMALRTELSKCGATVLERGDTLQIRPGRLNGAEIETYNDHRMAMAFAMLGLVVPKMQIRNPGCVKKTFPGFFAKLAAPPPTGLGATILNGRTGKPLEKDELLAE